jgi:hypothetical protein
MEKLQIHDYHLTNQIYDSELLVFYDKSINYCKIFKNIGFAFRISKFVLIYYVNSY